MEIVLLLGPLFTCWQPICLPTQRGRVHTCVPNWISTCFQANSLPISMPFPTSCIMPTDREKAAFRTWSRRGKGFSAGGFGSASYIQTPFFKTRCSQSNPKQAKQILEIFPTILPPDHVMQLGNGLFSVTCFWCQSIPLFFLQRLCSQRKCDGERGFRTKQTHKQKTV